jgi:hypothetical protein
MQEHSCSGFVLPKSARVFSLSQTRRLLLSTLIAYRLKNPRAQAFLPYSPDQSRERHWRHAVARLLLADSCYTLFQWPIRFRMLAIPCLPLIDEGNPMT